MLYPLEPDWPGHLKVAWDVRKEGEIDVATFLGQKRHEWNMWKRNTLLDDEIPTPDDVESFISDYCYNHEAEVMAYVSVDDEEPTGELEVWNPYQ